MTEDPPGPAKNPWRLTLPKTWTLWNILQWYGVLSLGLILVFNFPHARPHVAALMDWTLDTWILLLAVALNLVLLGLILRNSWARLGGILLGIGTLMLTPGTAFSTAFFESAGSWLVLYTVLLLGVGELLRFTLTDRRTGS